MLKDTQWQEIGKKLLSLLFDDGSWKRGMPPKGSELDATLDQALAEHGSVLVGHLHILNLRELITRKHADPESMLKKADAIAISVIEQFLGEADSFVHPDKGSYGFVFPNLNKEAGDLKCKVIADRIARMLREEDTAFSELLFKMTTQVYDHQTYVRDRSRRLNPRVDRVENYEDIRQYREMQEKQNWASRAVEAMTPTEGPPTSGSANEDDRANWYEQTSPTGNGFGEDIVCLYRPMCYVKNQLLTAYNCLPIRRMPGGKVAVGKEILTENNRQTAKAELDHFVLEKGIEALRHVLAKGQKLLIVVPVHFSTVDRQTYCDPYFGIFASLAQEARKLLVLEVVDAPKDIPQFRISDTVAKMRAKVRAVLGRVTLDSTDLDNWKGFGLHAIGFDLSEHPLAEEAALKEMEQFTARAKQLGLRTFVYGVKSLSLATSAVAAGFDYIEGDVVHSPVVTPESILRFNSKDLFARLLAPVP